MAQFYLCTLFVLISSRFIPVVVAQNLTETVWSSVIVTRNGDSIPLVSSSPTVLTPLGAQQLYSTGALFRDRYINGNNAIPDISKSEIDNTQTFSLSLLADYVEASAQAFIQGLYPPVQNTIISPTSVLANGSTISPPLGGYQYPLIYSYSRRDPKTIWLAGQANCNGYSASAEQYLSSSEYNATLASSQALYDSVASSVFGGELPPDDIYYGNAYYIFDYINYGYTHNTTIRNAVTADQLAQFRILADQWVYAINGNFSASGFFQNDHIRTIAGQTLAAEILALLFNNFNNNGATSKLNLLFTTFEPMVSLASLLGLPNIYTPFYGLPGLGASMVFEMFTSSVSTTQYPSQQDLQVRFLFRNSTDAVLSPYAIFGGSETMSLNDFTNAMGNIMMADVGVWCQTCQSGSVFCPFYTNVTFFGDSSPSSSSSSAQSSMKPAIAGVIGAMVALVVAGLVFLAMMLLFGVRFKRVGSKKRASLGGFKGSEKLASDVDVSVVKAGVGASVVGKGEGGGQGHERVGSWELSEGRAGGVGGVGKRASFEADGESLRGEPVKGSEVV
ncbi:hypothetical protein MMC30_006162 [Trapelia coarctata]|nr:hypothetical protein [Trapelia coarctata]